MTNLGLEKKLKSEELSLIRTDVGDKWIAKVLKEEKLFLGAEQVGHVLINDGFCLGDGVLVARILVHIFKQWPELFENCGKGKTCQVKKDISLDGLVVDYKSLDGLDKTFNDELGGLERIVARKSGTENKFRLMAEGENSARAKEILSSFENESLKEVLCVKD